MEDEVELPRIHELRTNGRRSRIATNSRIKDEWWTKKNCHEFTNLGRMEDEEKLPRIYEFRTNGRRRKIATNSRIKDEWRTYFYSLIYEFIRRFVEIS